MSTAGSVVTSITETPGHNGTGLNETTPMVLASPSSTLIIIMFVSGTFGNILALYVLIRTSKKHKWKTFNRLVGLLAVYDLSGILAITPMTFLVYSNNLQWVGGQPSCDYSSFCMIFAGLATVLTVGLMSLDRFLAVCFPYFYKANMNPRKVSILMLSSFFFALFIAILPIAKFGENVIHDPGSWCFFNFHGRSVLQQMFSYLYAFIGLFVISLTTILNVILITVLGMERKKKDDQQRKSSVHSISNRTRKRNDIYFMVFLSGILLVFGICWTPFMIRIIINQIRHSTICTKCDLFAVRLASFNQILDPWVYILLRKENIVRFVKYLKRRQHILVRRLSELQSYGSERLSQFRSSLGANSPNEHEKRRNSVRSENEENKLAEEVHVNPIGCNGTVDQGVQDPEQCQCHEAEVFFINNKS